MSTVYVRRSRQRGSIVTAEPFDFSRDQGVTFTSDASGEFRNATMVSRGRTVNVRPGDILVTDERGCWPCDAASFAALYQPLDEVVSPTEEPKP